MDPEPTIVPEEERRTGARETFPELVARLSRLSVTKHYDAYADIPWEDPAYRIVPDDPLWQAGDDHPLGATRTKSPMWRKQERIVARVV